MAQYYVDGTITSASGTGSGTLADPWGKTDDLIQFAIDQIMLGSGAGSTGDWINIVAGNINQTTSLNLLSYSPNNGRQLTILGYNGHQPTYDLGGVTWSNVHYDGIRLHNIRFVNFIAITNQFAIRLKYHGSVSFCVFDGENQPHATVLRIEGEVNILGCQFINFSPTAGLHQTLIYSGSSGGNWLKGCYFEKGGVNDYYMIFSYNTVIVDCVFVYTGSNNMAYAILPIRQARVSNCTFYRSPTAGQFYPIYFSTYQNNSMVNCYFENVTDISYNNSVSVNGNISTMLSGNRAYNSATLHPTQNLLPCDTLIYYDNDWDISESLLIDPANGDYRPKAGLIGAGFNLQDYGFPSSIKKQDPTIGAITNNIMPPRVRDIF